MDHRGKTVANKFHFQFLNSEFCSTLAWWPAFECLKMKILSFTHPYIVPNMDVNETKKGMSDRMTASVTIHFH